MNLIFGEGKRTLDAVGAVGAVLVQFLVWKKLAVEVGAYYLLPDLP